MTTSESTRFVYPEALNPAQRPLLLFHRHLRAVRASAGDLAEYDLLMFRPEGPDGEPPADWVATPAAKYLKHRSLEWAEAASIDELPEAYQALAEALDAALDDPPGDASETDPADEQIGGSS